MIQTNVDDNNNITNNNDYNHDNEFDNMPGRCKLKTINTSQ